MDKKHRDNQRTNQNIALMPLQLKPLLSPLYTVYLLNNESTPMSFIMEVLERYFSLNQEAVAAIMLQVHSHGRGICGVFSRDIAETKVLQVNEYAKRNHQPLICKWEENF